MTAPSPATADTPTVRSARGRTVVRRAKEAERGVARWGRENGYPGADRTVRTGYRTAERESPDTGDVGLCPGLIVQVKTYTDPARMERAVPRWLAEAETQRCAAEADLCLLVVKRNGCADAGDWWCWLPLVALTCLQSGDDLHVQPEAWSDVDRMPCRVLLRDAALLLREAGYGEPLCGEEAS